MTKEQLEYYRMGYIECRNVTIYRLRELLKSKSGLRTSAEEMLAELKDEADRDTWLSVQEEVPGITREEYEAELIETGEAIRTTYYSKNGYLKPRLVKK